MLRIGFYNSFQDQASNQFSMRIRSNSNHTIDKSICDAKAPEIVCITFTWLRKNAARLTIDCQPIDKPYEPELSVQHNISVGDDLGVRPLSVYT